MIKKADFDQKGAVRQVPNTGVCLQAKQTVLRGPGGGGGGPWITVFSWNPWTLKGTEKRSYLWLRRSDRTKFSWWTWTWFYSKPMKDMSRLYYEKAETNKKKQNFSEENERFLIKVILRWIIECLVRGHVAELFCFMSQKIQLPNKSRRSTKAWT